MVATPEMITNKHPLAARINTNILSLPLNIVLHFKRSEQKYEPMFLH
jgi:hypothetical protein